MDITPIYNLQTRLRAAAIAGGNPCSPQLLPELLEKALKGQDLSGFGKKK